MKKYLTLGNAVAVAIGMFSGYFAVGLYDQYQSDKSFMEMCETMGGVPVVNTAKNVCIKPEAAIE
jgi:hypothetical protein